MLYTWKYKDILFCLWFLLHLLVLVFLSGLDCFLYWLYLLFDLLLLLYYWCILLSLYDLFEDCCCLRCRLWFCMYLDLWSHRNYSSLCILYPNPLIPLMDLVAFYCLLLNRNCRWCCLWCCRWCWWGLVWGLWWSYVILHWLCCLCLCPCKITISMLIDLSCQLRWHCCC